MTFDDPLRGFDQLFSRSMPAVAGSTVMPMDVYRRDDDLWVHIDLPGVAEASLDISIERNVLTVSAERGWSREDGDRVYLAERRTGTMRRQIHLGDELDTDGIEADFDNGVLTLRIPVSEKARPRHIAIGNRSRAIESTATVADG